jgi:tripeptidyl-peptidase-1
MSAYKTNTDCGLQYANPEAFNDVTEGSNPGCGSPGFTAAKGWDPVTGLG